MHATKYSTMPNHTCICTYSLRASGISANGEQRRGPCEGHKDDRGCRCHMVSAYRIVRTWNGMGRKKTKQNNTGNDTGTNVSSMAGMAGRWT